MQQEHYKGYCLTHKNNLWYIDGFTNSYYSIDAAKAFIDIMAIGITKANEICKPFTTQKN